MLSLIDNPSAFAHFYTDEVMVRGTPGSEARRHIAVALKACVFDGGFADPLDDGDAESNMRRIEISFPLRAWPFTEPPQTGDIAEFDGTSFAVKSVSRRLGDWVLDAREKGGAQ